MTDDKLTLRDIVESPETMQAMAARANRFLDRLSRISLYREPGETEPLIEVVDWPLDQQEDEP